jgi:hypothetical protein
LIVSCDSAGSAKSEMATAVTNRRIMGVSLGLRIEV